ETCILGFQERRFTEQVEHARRGHYGRARGWRRGEREAFEGRNGKLIHDRPPGPLRLRPCFIKNACPFRGFAAAPAQAAAAGVMAMYKSVGVLSMKKSISKSYINADIGFHRCMGCLPAGSPKGLFIVAFRACRYGACCNPAPFPDKF